MVGFLRWAGSIATGTLNSIARFVFLLLLLLFALFLIGLAEGDGLPKNMVLALDLRGPIADSSPVAFNFGAKPVTVMDVVLGLDAAGRDDRVKGVVVRVGVLAHAHRSLQEIDVLTLRVHGVAAVLGVPLRDRRVLRRFSRGC